MKSKVLLLMLFILLSVTPVFSQSNEIVDVLLAEENATFGPTVYLILTAGELIDENATIEGAMSALGENKIKLKEKTAEDPVYTKELAYLIMESLDLGAGIMYRIIPSPRYGYKELRFRKIIRPDNPPGRMLKSDEVMVLLASAMQWKEKYR